MLAAGTWLALTRPTVSSHGIDYEELQPLTPEPDQPPVHLRPIPIPLVDEIRVREGRTGRGAILGAAIGFGLAAVAGFGIAYEGWFGTSDPDIAAGVFGAVIGGAILAAPGVLAGAFLGEANYSWQPVFRADIRDAGDGHP